MKKSRWESWGMWWAENVHLCLAILCILVLAQTRAMWRWVVALTAGGVRILGAWLGMGGAWMGACRVRHSISHIRNVRGTHVERS